MNGGLLFSGNVRPYDKRTSINFTPDNPVTLKDKFSISFALSVWDKNTYGRIFRAHDNNGTSIWLSYAYHLNSDTSYLILAVNKNETAIKIPVPKDQLYRNNWFNIKLNFDLKHNNITASLNGKPAAHAEFKLPKALKLFIASGYSPEDKDSPRLALADFQIIAKNNVALHRWKLDEPAGNKAYDNLGNSDAEVENASWLAFRHMKWKQVDQFQFSRNDSYAITFDSLKQRILFFDEKYYVDYDVLTQSWTNIPYNNERPYLVNRVIYNHRKNVIQGYYWGQGQAALFDDQKCRWTRADSCRYAEERYYGHTTFVNPLNGDLMMFGGYGWFEFKNDLRKYNFTKKQWEKLHVKGDSISPRTQTLITPYKNNGEFLLIGGMGTNSGKQEEGVKLCYDVYLLNMADTTLKKLGEVKGDNHDLELMCYGIYHNDHSVYFPGFYRGKDSGRLYLHKLDLNKFIIHRYTPAISLKFNGNESFCFFRSKTDELYMIFNSLTKNDTALSSIYKIAFPPADYNAELISEYSDDDINNAVYGLMILAGLTLSAAAVYITRRKSASSKSDLSGYSAQLSEPEHFNPLNFFGALRIFNKSKTEITNNLSPKLRELLLLIILNMKTQGDVLTGISSEKLTLLLWPESDQQHAKNNRNSSMAKLRQFLHRADGMDIQYSEHGWLFTCQSDTDCDYLTYMKLKNDITRNIIDEHSLALYMGIVGKGRLLDDLSFEWLDPVKVCIESEVTAQCFTLASNDKLKDNPEIIIELMNIILRWDPINENALRLKISTLLGSGRNGEAYSAYELFCLEYKKVFDTDYTLPFRDLTPGPTQFL